MSSGSMSFSAYFANTAAYFSGDSSCATRLPSLYGPLADERESPQETGAWLCGSELVHDSAGFCWFALAGPWGSLEFPAAKCVVHTHSQCQTLLLCKETARPSCASLHLKFWPLLRRCQRIDNLAYSHMRIAHACCTVFYTFRTTVKGLVPQMCICIPFNDEERRASGKTIVHLETPLGNH